MMSVKRLSALARTSLAGMMLVTGLALGASGINFIVQALLAYRFGLGVEVDSYAFSLSVPIFFAGLVASIVSYTVVPLIALEGANPARQAGMCGTTLIAGGGVALVLAMMAVPGTLVQPLTLPTGSAIAVNPHIDAMIAIAWLIAAMQVVGAVLIAQLTACHRPIAAATLGLLPGVGTAMVLLVFTPGIVLVSICFLAGSTLAAAIGFYLQREQLTFRLAHIDLRSEITDLMRKGAWAALALSCFSSFAISDAFWAPRMSAGSLASLGYVQRLIIGVGGLIVAGPSALYVPRFAALVEAGDGVGFARLLTRTLLVVLGLGAAAIAILYFQSEAVVALLFRRGAFGQSDVVTLASLFRTMAPGVVAMLGVVILMRALFCLKRTEKVAAAMGVGWPILYFSLSGIFHHRGVIGLAQSYTIAWLVIAITIAFYVFLRIRGIANPARDEYAPS